LHHNIHTIEEVLSADFLPVKEPVKILLTSGASCPDAVVEGVIRKLSGFYTGALNHEELIRQFR
jgi:4-hydroxy-3-methylbut-2-enyl diphosphate reductase